MRIWKAIVMAGALGLGVAGCAKARAKERPAPASARQEQPPWKPVGEGLGLFERLDAERAARPADTVRAEAVLDAIATAGMPVATRKQYLGATVHALFCLGGSSSGLAVAVCEYPDEAAARAGRALALAEFARVAPHREIRVNGKTTLSIAWPLGDATPDVVAGALGAFDALSVD